MVQGWIFTNSLLLQLHSIFLSYGTLLPPPQEISMQSLNMRHLLRWTPPQTNCGTVHYSVQFQGEFERQILNGSWEEAPNCQQILQSECDLTSDLASDSDYNIRVRAECDEQMSPWDSPPTSFNRRDTVLLAPAMSVKVAFNSIHVDIRDLPLAVTVNVSIWIQGYKQEVISDVIAAPESHVSFANLQEGNTYCMTAEALLETSGTISKRNSTGTQCVPIPRHHSTLLLPVTLGITVVIAAVVAIVLACSVTRCGHTRKQVCCPHEPLPRILLDDWPVPKLNLVVEEMLQPTHPVIQVHPCDERSF